VNVHIFREYDIRGVVDEDLTPDVVRQLGLGIGSYLARRGARRLSLGRDGRLSSPDIHTWLIGGLLDTGATIVDLGIVPTSLSYYSTHRLPVDGAVMITGSHNPPDYNGFKVTLGTDAIYGAEIQRIRDIIVRGDFERGRGSIEEYDIKPEYIDDLAARLNPSRPVKVAVDAGNGVAGLVAGPLLERLGCPARILYAEVDGNFPHHHPDPTVEDNLADLKKAVVEGGFEAGIAYDGDGDRIGVVDEKGGVLWGDQLLAILAREVLRDKPGATIIGEVKCSRLLFEDIRHHGGKAVMWKVGHSLIKSKMHDSGAELAGEMSGHIFFSHRFYGFDDAVYVTGRLLEVIAGADRPLSRFLEDWPKLYNTPEIRIECPDDVKFEVVSKVRDHFRARYEVIDVDGMRVNMPGGWALLRASNTQPVVVLRFEAESPEMLERIQNEVQDALQAARERL